MLNTERRRHSVAGKHEALCFHHWGVSAHFAALAEDVQDAMIVLSPKQADQNYIKY